MKHIQMQRLPLISNCLVCGDPFASDLLAATTTDVFLPAHQCPFPPSPPSQGHPVWTSPAHQARSVCQSEPAHRCQPCLALPCFTVGVLVDALGSVFHQSFLILSFFYRLSGLSEMQVCPVLVLPST
jgi:hypothetical protein